VQHALNAAGEKAAPVVHRVSTSAAPHRGKIAAGVVALVIAVLTLRRRRRGEPT
jgi:MYXO-CTERM domain-containing protein